MKLAFEQKTALQLLMCHSITLTFSYRRKALLKIDLKKIFPTVQLNKQQKSNKKLDKGNY